MAIFGNASVKDGATTINVIGTTTDIYLNYIFGVLILIPFALSTLLNPVVFIYKYNRPISAASLHGPLILRLHDKHMATGHSILHVIQPRARRLCVSNLYCNKAIQSILL